jgi:hypothetical protein
VSISRHPQLTSKLSGVNFAMFPVWKGAGIEGIATVMVTVPRAAKPGNGDPAHSDHAHREHPHGKVVANAKNRELHSEAHVSLGHDLKFGSTVTTDSGALELGVELDVLPHAVDRFQKEHLSRTTPMGTVSLAFSAEVRRRLSCSPRMELEVQRFTQR